MSVLDDPRITEIEGGYRVVNDEFGPVKVFPDNNWSDGGWRAYFDSSTSTVRHPNGGMAGSFSDDLEETLTWALRTEAP